MTITKVKLGFVPLQQEGWLFELRKVLETHVPCLLDMLARRGLRLHDQSHDLAGTDLPFRPKNWGVFSPELCFHCDIAIRAWPVCGKCLIAPVLSILQPVL